MNASNEQESLTQESSATENSSSVAAATCPTPAIRNVPNRGRLPYDLRKEIAEISANLPQASNPNNGEEGTYPNYPYQANYSKGLEKDLSGGRSDPLATSYRDYITILDEARRNVSSRFSQIRLGGNQSSPPNCACQDNRPARKQTNPQAGLAADLQGTDPQAVNTVGLFFNPSESIRPAPRIDQNASGTRTKAHENAAEMIELYWMSLLRDLPFKSYYTPNSTLPGKPAAYPNVTPKMAADDLNVLRSFFAEKYPTDSSGNVTSNTIFRGSAFGDNVGPFLSQYLLRGNTVRCLRGQTILQRPEDGIIPQGRQPISQRQTPIYGFVDFLRNVCQWRCEEQGVVDSTGLDPVICDDKGTFIFNLRQLANWVHVDTTIQHFRNAALLMLNENPLDGVGPLLTQRAFDSFNTNTAEMRIPFPFDPGLPYSAGMPDAANQTGFVTFGPLHPLTLIQEAAIRALKAAWFHKWFVHRRARPEEFAGLVHYQKMHENGGGVRPAGPYPCLDPLILDLRVGSTALPNNVLQLVFDRNKLTDSFAGQTVQGEANGSYLLPQVYPEGSPTHPAYPSGHATVSGACATILKALFDESVTMTDPTNQIPTDPSKMPAAFIAKEDGSKLEVAPGQGNPTDFKLTVEGELNKLASNISIGRNAAGVHWRSDATQGMELGEAVAARLLIDQAYTFHEPFSLSFRRFFRNHRVRITKPNAGIGGWVYWEIIDQGSGQRIDAGKGEVKQ